MLGHLSRGEEVVLVVAPNERKVVVVTKTLTIFQFR